MMNNITNVDSNSNNTENNKKAYTETKRNIESDGDIQNSKRNKTNSIIRKENISDLSDSEEQIEKVPKVTIFNCGSKVNLHNISINMLGYLSAFLMFQEINEIFMLTSA